MRTVVIDRNALARLDDGEQAVVVALRCQLGREFDLHTIEGRCLARRVGNPEAVRRERGEQRVGLVQQLQSLFAIVGELGRHNELGRVSCVGTYR